MRTTFRLRPEAEEYFKNRMKEWHLVNQTETLHRIISENKRLESENSQLKIDNSSLKREINIKPNLQAAQGKCLIHGFQITREECLQCQIKAAETQCPKIKPYMRTENVRQDHFSVSGLDKTYPPPKV